MIGLDVGEPRCSATGCRAAPDWRVNWRNPRLHTPDRVKVWLACEEHREHLSGYLSSRGFPTLVTSLDEIPELVPEPR